MRLAIHWRAGLLLRGAIDLLENWANRNLMNSNKIKCKKSAPEEE